MGAARQRTDEHHGPAGPRKGTVVGEVYLPILILGILGALFGILSVAAPTFIGPRRYNRARLEAYECGIDPTPQPIGGGRFPIRYYLTAMLFIVFDIEIVFLYPFAVAFDQLRIFGLIEMALFIVTVLVVYGYVWRRGGLEWD
jgi:NADH-quinone oxidoreductase subunit A